MFSVQNLERYSMIQKKLSENLDGTMCGFLYIFIQTQAIQNWFSISVENFYISKTLLSWQTYR